jgi:hypothetical protein
MKVNRWTKVLIGCGLLSIPAVLSAEETPGPLLTAVSSTTLSGYVDTSAQWNLGTGNAGVPTYSFSGGKADGFNLNVVKLMLEKPLDESQWAAGYKVDLLFGPDANYLSTSSTGIDSSDFAIKQAYVALRAPIGNGLDLKMGVWDTVIGYEVFESPYNPNHTRSYGYTIEPTTHTGLLASYKFSDLISATAGVANTVGPNINENADPEKAESYKAYMGSVTLTAPESLGFLAGSTLTGGVVNGFNSATPDGSSSSYIPGDQTSWYVGGTFTTPIEGLKVGACYDYLSIDDQPLRGSTYANASALYASFKLTEKMTLYGRGEYATSGNPLLYGAEKVVAVTGTLQYDLWKNVLSRLEFRWDHAADGTEPYGGEDSAGGKKNSYIIMANIAYKF